jgi:hypothetical protein
MASKKTSLITTACNKPSQRLRKYPCFAARAKPHNKIAVATNPLTATPEDAENDHGPNVARYDHRRKVTR